MIPVIYPVLTSDSSYVHLQADCPVAKGYVLVFAIVKLIQCTNFISLAEISNFRSGILAFRFVISCHPS